MKTTLLFCLGRPAIIPAQLMHDWFASLRDFGTVFQEGSYKNFYLLKEKKQ
jgi:hypothetical protein